MKRCGKPLTEIKYNHFRRQFLAESNKKTKKTKMILLKILCKNFWIIYRLIF